MRSRNALPERVPTTHLAVIERGMVVSYCEVYRLDDIAQIESVATVPEYRRRGLRARGGALERSS